MASQPEQERPVKAAGFAESAVRHERRDGATAPLMKGGTPDFPTASRPGLMHVWLIMALAMLVSIWAISDRSLWIDETLTAVKALQPTLGDWWQTMVQEKVSDLQMPFYMFYVWCWEKIFGAGEWALRLANLPWFVAGAVAFISSFPSGDRRRPVAAYLVLFCPLAWHYLDEARPYAMQLGASLLVAASLRWLGRDTQVAFRQDGRHVALLVCGILLLCGSSMLGMIWGASAFGLALAVLPPARILAVVRKHCFMWVLAGVTLLLLASYYLWTLKTGARAAVGATNWGSLFFTAYELLGFGGLGPGRFEIRSDGLAAFQARWIEPALYGIATAIVLGVALAHGFQFRSRKGLAVAFCCAAPAACILAAGLITHFRVLGRHFAPFMPVLLLVFASGISELWSRRGMWAKLAICLFGVLSLASCLSLRFAARHAKDDYRGAATVARTALENGQTVWWSAVEQGARYYSVPIGAQSERSATALLLVNPVRESLDDLPAPDLVIVSRPDMFDRRGGLGDYLQKGRFHVVGQLAAFTFWERNRE